MMQRTSRTQTFDVTAYGAAGDGTTLDTAALQAAITACAAAGGGTVFVPAGRYVTGSLFLESDVTLYLDAGATLLASENPADYPLIHSRWEGTEQETYAPLITGSGLRNIAVTGRGTVDGRGAVWWRMLRERALRYPRPRLISFSGCRNVLIEGVTLTNSPSWTVHPVRCENVNVHRVTIANPPDSPNTDGINPESCHGVHISDCHVSAGDDCITIKAGKETDAPDNLVPCEDITITNCTMARGHGGVVIGSETSGSVRNVVISNCVFTGTDRGIRLKSRRGRGGVVEDVRVTNIVMDGVLCPFAMNLYYACGAWGDPVVSDKRPHPVSGSTPHFRHIHLSHITAHGARLAAAWLYGLPEMPLEDVWLSDIVVLMDPDAEPGYPEMADDMELLRRAGVFVRHACGLRLHNVQVRGQLGPALALEDVVDVDIEGASTPTPPADAPVIRLRNAESVFVRGCRAGAGTGVFLGLEGERTQAIVLGSNDLARAAQAVGLAPEVRPDAAGGVR